MHWGSTRTNELRTGAGTCAGFTRKQSLSEKATNCGKIRPSVRLPHQIWHHHSNQTVEEFFKPMPQKYTEETASVESYFRITLIWSRSCSSIPETELTIPTGF